MFDDKSREKFSKKNRNQGKNHFDDIRPDFRYQSVEKNKVIVSKLKIFKSGNCSVIV